MTVPSPVHTLWGMATDFERATGGVPLIVTEYQSMAIAQALMEGEPRMTAGQADAIVAACLYVVPRIERPPAVPDLPGPPPKRGIQGMRPTGLILDEISCPSPLLAIHPATLAECERLAR